jgi:hypothetical protein
MALDENFTTAQSTADLPFGGLGVSLEACEEYAGTLHIQVVAWTQAFLFDGMDLHEPPAALSGYRLLTALGCEIRGR